MTGDDKIRLPDGRWLVRPVSSLDWAMARMRGNADAIADAMNTEAELPWRERLRRQQQRRKQLREQRQRKKLREREGEL